MHLFIPLIWHASPQERDDEQESTFDLQTFYELSFYTFFRRQTNRVCL